MTNETSIDHIAPSAEFWIAHGPEAVHYGQLDTVALRSCLQFHACTV